MGSEAISAERAASQSPIVSNGNQKGTIHAPALRIQGPSRRTFCGKGTGVVMVDTGADWLAVTCSDCLAAKRADQEAKA